MIKASDFRTNNLVFLIKDGVKKEYELTAFDIYKLDESDCADIEPIPITEEILKRFGWAYYNQRTSGDLTKDFGGKLDVDFVNGQIQIKSHYETSDAYRPIPSLKFFHQLQNLYYELDVSREGLIKNE